MEDPQVRTARSFFFVEELWQHQTDLLSLFFALQSLVENVHLQMHPLGPLRSPRVRCSFGSQPTFDLLGGGRKGSDPQALGVHRCDWSGTFGSGNYVQ